MLVALNMIQATVMLYAHIDRATGISEEFLRMNLAVILHQIIMGATSLGVEYQLMKTP